MFSIQVLSFILISSLTYCKEFCNETNFDSVIIGNNSLQRYFLSKSINETHFKEWILSEDLNEELISVKQKESIGNMSALLMSEIRIQSVPQCSGDCDFYKLNSTSTSIYRTNGNVFITKTYNITNGTLIPNNNELTQRYIKNMAVYTRKAFNNSYQPIIYWPKGLALFSLINEKPYPWIRYRELFLNVSQNTIQFKNLPFDYAMTKYKNRDFTSAFVWPKTNTIHAVVESMKIGYVLEYIYEKKSFSETNKTIVDFLGCSALLPDSTSLEFSPSDTTLSESSPTVSTNDSKKEKTSYLLIIIIIIVLIVVLVFIAIFIVLCIRKRSGKKGEQTSERSKTLNKSNEIKGQNSTTSVRTTASPASSVGNQK